MSLRRPPRRTFITADAIGPKHINTRPTSSQLESLVNPLSYPTNHRPVQKALSDGGQTRMLKVDETVKSIFGREPSKVSTRRGRRYWSFRLSMTDHLLNPACNEFRKYRPPSSFAHPSSLLLPLTIVLAFSGPADAAIVVDQVGQKGSGGRGSREAVAAITLSFISIAIVYVSLYAISPVRVTKPPIRPLASASI